MHPPPDPTHHLCNLKLVENDVERAIGKLKNKKSTGYDKISACAVKGNPKFFSKLLTP